MTALVELGGWPAVMHRLLRRESLDADAAGAALDEVLEGRATPVQIAAFAVGLRVKGAGVEEISGLLLSVLAHAEPVDAGDNLVDICGTGVDHIATSDVSTMAAFVVAGAGAKVCRHGSRAASSSNGSADMLEALGVAIDLGPAGVARCVAEVGMGFCFTPRYYPASVGVASLRREVGVPPPFNFLAPLINPARPRRRVVGVSDPAMAETMTEVLIGNNSLRAMVVYGHDGTDELTTTTSSTVIDWTGGAFPHKQTYVVDPAEFGLRSAALDDLRGADPETNAAMARRVLQGERGPHRDIVVLNAAAGLVVAGHARHLREGVRLAAETLDHGYARRVLENLVAVSREEAANSG